MVASSKHEKLCFLVKGKGFEVHYQEHSKKSDVLFSVLKKLKSEKILKLISCETHDYELNRRLRNHTHKLSLKLEILSSPMFLNTQEQNSDYRNGKRDGLWLIFINFRGRG